MKPQDFKLPLTKEEKQPFFHEGVFFIYWRQLKVGEFANARGGRFASDPPSLLLEKLEAGRVGCKGAPLAKAKLQLSSGTSIYRNNLKNRDFDKEPTQSKTDSSGYFGIPRYTEETFELKEFLSFCSEKKVVLEYCSGNGTWIAEKALRNPDTQWIAVEKRLDRVKQIWSKSKNLGLVNLLIVCGMAEIFTEKYLPKDCIDTVYINFPDPWPKRRHAKHRLFQQTFIAEMSRIVKKEGSAIIVTDDPLYSQQISSAMHQSNLWSSVFPPPFFTTEWPEYGSSFFDTLWREKGKQIHYFQFKNQKH